MKTRKILAIAIIAIMFLALFIGTVNALSAIVYDQIVVTSETLTNGQDKPATLKAESVEVGKTLQLHAYHNSRNVTTQDDGTETETNKIGNTVEEATWESSNTSVATISETGLVTGVKVGTTTISVTGRTAQPYTEEITLTVTAAKTGAESESAIPAAFKNAKVELKKEKDSLFYDSKLYITGIKTSEVKAYMEENKNNIYVVMSDKETVPTTKDEFEKIVYKNNDFTFPVACFMTLRDNDKMDTADTYANEINARKVDNLYATIVTTYYDEATRTNLVKKLSETTKLTRPASLEYGNRIKFSIYDDETYMAVNEPSSEKQKKMLMKVAKITDLSKYTTENKYAKLLEDINKATSFLYNSEVEFDRAGSGGTNAINKNLKIADAKFEVGSYYIVYAKLLGDGKYEEVEDVELYQATGANGVVTMLQSVTKFDENNTEPRGNTVPTNTTGDNTIAIKKIPQTGATPVFMIVLGSTILVATLIFVANKKYRDIK